MHAAADDPAAVVGDGSLARLAPPKLTQKATLLYSSSSESLAPHTPAAGDGIAGGAAATLAAAGGSSRRCAFCTLLTR